MKHLDLVEQSLNEFAERKAAEGFELITANPRKPTAYRVFFRKADKLYIATRQLGSYDWSLSNYGD